MIYVTICDDEPSQCLFIETILKQMEPSSSLAVTSFTSFSDFMADCDENFLCDICFLDIDLIDGSGISLAHMLRRKNPALLIIYISAHSDYVFDTFLTRPFDFLCKPLSSHQVEEVFLRAYMEISSASVMTVCSGHQQITLFYKDILYIESKSRQLFIHTLHRCHTVYRKLDDFSSSMDEMGLVFLRIHKSVLVNPRYIAEYGGTYLILTDGTSLSISRSLQREVQLQFLRLHKLGGEL